jgi:hypothetical protein
MPITLSEEWFSARWSQAKDRAGKRFTEQLDVPLPLARYFSAATQTESFFQEFSQMASSLEKRWLQRPSGTPPAGSENGVNRLNALVPSLITALQNIAACRRTSPASVPIAPGSALVSETGKAVSPPLSAAHENAQTASVEKRDAAEAWVNWLSGTRSRIAQAEELLTSNVAAATNNPCVLMLGAAGTGKTHLLCEMTKEQVARGAPALLFLAQAFQSPFDDVLARLSSSVGWTESPEEFFATLDGIAHRRHTRCLISIDAINEGHRDSWTRAIPRLIDLSRRYAGLAIVISCRSPFEKILVPDPDALGLIAVQHYGFPPEVQSNAVEKYFKAYGIPLPEVPLLEEEFANPLFLKLFCEALEKVTIKAKHKQINEIAAGQRGMTHILEYFVDEKDRAVAKLLGTKVGSSWDFLKELAKFLATQHKQSISLAEAKQIANFLQPSGMAPGTFLQALINEDILAEDVIFDEHSQAIEVVRPTYQKFADHLIARYLLDHQLDRSSEASIKESLRDPLRLGSYFTDEHITLENINIVQALLIEFPTRIKNRAEVFDYLDAKTILLRVCEAFVEGLYWREPSSINSQTSHWGQSVSRT